MDVCLCSCVFCVFVCWCVECIVFRLRIGWFCCVLNCLCICLWFLCIVLWFCFIVLMVVCYCCFCDVLSFSWLCSFMIVLNGLFLCLLCIWCMLGLFGGGMLLGGVVCVVLNVRVSMVVVVMVMWEVFLYILEIFCI